MDSSSTHLKTVLLMRVLSFVFLLSALILISTNMLPNLFTGDKLDFHDFYAYRYMMSTVVIGFAYNLLQMVFSICTVISGKRVLRGDGGYLFDFFGDKMISYLIISGSASGFGWAVEINRVSPSNPFTDKANASASVLLVGFFFTAIASIFTSFALPKKPIN